MNEHLLWRSDKHYGENTKLVSMMFSQTLLLETICSVTN